MNKKLKAYFQLATILISIISFSYFIYYSSSNEKNPLDDLFITINNKLTKPVFSIVSASTLSTPSLCCEKLKGDSAYCINAEPNKCDNSYKTSPTSCESTSYCRLGTCYDSSEGICMENTPQRTCQEQGGTWDAKGIEEVPQCQLGCCVIADQAAFVPLVRCKRLSSVFGVEINYKTDIFSEIDCIATAQSQDTGACVYEKDFERICKFTTRDDCNAGNSVEVANGSSVSLSTEKKFYKDYLCSAEELNTICARQASTRCYQGDVYWTDSCGNKENIYSSDKDKSWNNGKVLNEDLICSANDGTNKNCGNCDYLLGTRCQKWEGTLGLGKPSYGEYFCKKTECVDRNGNKRINGESWCIYDSQVGNASDLVGSRYYKEVCVDGEVRVEPCADYRNEICLENIVAIEGGNYQYAACRVNRWQDCVAQIRQKDCENIDRRDCFWLPSVEGMVLGGGSEQSVFSNPSTSNTFSNPTSTQTFTNAPVTGKIITGNALFGGDDEETQTEETITNRPNGICVPNYSPGLKFWENGDSRGICSQASAKCIVKFEKGLIGGEKCVEGCDCLKENWAMEANKVCTALGDCGGYLNIQGKYTGDGYLWKVDGKEKKFSANDINKIMNVFTGKVVGVGFAMFELVSGADVIDTSDLRLVDNIPKLKSGLDPAETLTTTAQKVSQPFNEYNPSQAGVPTGNPGLGTLTTTAQKVASFTSKFTPSNLVGTKDAFVNGKLYSVKVYDVSGVHTAQLPSDAGGGVIQFKGNNWNPVAGTAPDKYGGSSTLSQLFNTQVGGWTDSLLTGLQWGAIAYGLGSLVGGLFGFNSQNTQALSLALGGGTFAWQFLSTSNWAAGVKIGTTTLQGLALPIGIGVAAAIFIMMYKTESTQVIEFNCMPWQAPSGGNECEICNDENLPCSEYRCKSLGQNCEIVNKGTDKEQCVNVNPRDVVAPKITPDKDELTTGYQYTNVKDSPPGPGFRIKSNMQAGCIKAFTSLEFGINTDEPAQCKVDINHTTKFDDMTNYFGGTNLYLYNHTEQLVLPSAKALENSSIILENGKDMVLYIRCRDKNGNANEAEYAVKFCVDPTPDNTAPEIKATSINNNACVAENRASANVDFYTNEPAQCKWSKDDQSYDNMQNSMICTNQMYQINAMQLFTCRANLTGISREDTIFYIRCRDQPGEIENQRNENKQSYVFTLKSSTALKIKDIKPNSTIFGAVNPAHIDLEVQTLFGCESGKSICYYSITGNNNDYVMFYDTNKEDGIHTQRQDLAAGTYTYYIKCVDSGGNVAVNTTQFKLDIDTNAPVIARIYEDAGMLKIVTVRKSECAYSFDNCDFTFAEGTAMPYANSTSHVVEWQQDKTYYIKCRDEFRNENADCSSIVRPVFNFLKN